MQFVAFENFTSAHYTKLQGKSCCYLLIMYMKINQRVQIDILTVRVLFVICTHVKTLHLCYNLVL